MMMDQAREAAVWARVRGTAQSLSREAVEGLYVAEAKAASTYRRLARRGPGRQVLSALAAGSDRLCRTLKAMCYLLDGTVPPAPAPPAVDADFPAALAAAYHEAARGAAEAAVLQAAADTFQAPLARLAEHRTQCAQQLLSLLARQL